MAIEFKGHLEEKSVNGDQIMEIQFKGHLE